MAEETATPTTTAVETSPVAESAIPPPEEPTLNKPTEAPHEEEEVKGPKDVVSAEPSETSDAVPLASDHKRKLEDIKGEDEKEEEEEDGDVKASEKKDGNETKVVEPEDAGDSKRQRVEGGGVDGLGVEGSQVVQKEEDPSLANGQLPYTENVEPGSVETVQKSAEDVAQPGTLPSAEQDSSRKIEIPNSKVGALIGKAGETIRLLQSNSGARIQITRDAEADPSSSSRPVELIGTLENINKAEQMIKDVIAEAVAGGSPALVARGFGAAQSSSEVHEMQVPNEKVGVIIGKGGETIKTLQTKSQARIQIIPQHLPEGDLSKERTVRITGNKKQIESAKIMIMEVMNQMQLTFHMGVSTGFLVCLEGHQVSLPGIPKAIILVVLPRNLNGVPVVRIQANPKCNRELPMIILKEDGNRGLLFQLKPLVAMITTHKGREMAWELNNITLLL
ncbi:far upstream element-binding protein 2-like isoform X3 [Asparagus officinalis]|uniref:far upstream element-binding protein 2-like isoform X3 n=1 Tax=Asparagus officinalis TaxID=4686 RepID=UPI00098E34E4|nr:far upstream element-binding protein 2-like isoform X3 [Asparagus officinalis]